MTSKYLIVPVHLQTLFDTMDFIGHAKVGFKPCFNGMYYVNSNSWLGSLYRFKNGESQSSKGNDIIRKCCQESVQAYNQYEDTDFSEIILNKMLSLREGILAIRETYLNDENEVKTCSHLMNSVLELDRKIPKDILNTISIISTITKTIEKPLKEDDQGI